MRSTRRGHDDPNYERSSRALLVAALPIWECPLYFRLMRWRTRSLLGPASSQPKVMWNSAHRQLGLPLNFLLTFSSHCSAHAILSNSNGRLTVQRTFSPVLCTTFADSYDRRYRVSGSDDLSNGRAHDDAEACTTFITSP
jgi:hypothetical protein